MDLPTYTNIWRIEKRLYKLYDLRLPMPLPLVQIGVFVGFFLPWIILLQIVQVPFHAAGVTAYLVPPGVLTWLATRPVIEGKRLTELMISQIRYLTEAKTWARLTPIREPDEVAIVGRVWLRRRGLSGRVHAGRQAASVAPVPSLHGASEQTAPPLHHQDAPARPAAAWAAGAPEPGGVTEASSGGSVTPARAPRPSRRATPHDGTATVSPAAAASSSGRGGGRRGGERRGRHGAGDPRTTRADDPRVTRTDHPRVNPGDPKTTDPKTTDPKPPTRRTADPKTADPKTTDPSHQDRGRERRSPAQRVRSPRSESGDPRVTRPESVRREPLPPPPVPQRVRGFPVPPPAARPADDVPPEGTGRPERPAARAAETEETSGAGTASPRHGYGTGRQRSASHEPERPAASTGPSWTTGAPGRPGTPARPERPDGSPTSIPFAVPPALGRSGRPPETEEPKDRERPTTPAESEHSETHATPRPPSESSAPWRSGVPWAPGQPGVPSALGRPGTPAEPAAAVTPAAEDTRTAAAPGDADVPEISDTATAAGETNTPAARTGEPSAAERDASSPAGSSPAAPSSSSSPPAIPGSATGRHAAPPRRSAGTEAASGHGSGREGEDARRPAPTGEPDQETPTAPVIRLVPGGRHAKPGGRAPAAHEPPATPGPGETTPEREETRSPAGPAAEDGETVTAGTPDMVAEARTDQIVWPRPPRRSTTRPSAGETTSPTPQSPPFDDRKPGPFARPGGASRGRSHGEETPPPRDPRQPAPGGGAPSSPVRPAPKPAEPQVPTGGQGGQSPAAAGPPPGPASAPARRRPDVPAPATPRSGESTTPPDRRPGDPASPGRRSGERPPEPGARPDEHLTGPAQRPAQNPAASSGQQGPAAARHPDPATATGPGQQPRGPAGPHERRPVHPRPAAPPKAPAAGLTPPSQVPLPPAPRQETPARPASPPRPAAQPVWPDTGATPPESPARGVRSGPASPVRPGPLPQTAHEQDGREDDGRGLRRIFSGGGGGDGDYEQRVRTAFEGSRRVVVLGCTGGAGQTVTGLMLGHTFAQHRGDRIVAVDVNPGPGAMARRTRTETRETLTSLITHAEQVTGYQMMRRYTSVSKSGLEVVAAGKNPVQALDDRDYALAMRTLDRFYAVTLLDAAAAVVARVLPYADQIVLVAPASSDAPRAVAMTFEWLDGHGYEDLRTRAVTVINGVSRRSMEDVEQAESVARGRCRALVRIPWDDHLSLDRAPRNELRTLRSSTRKAYIALGGVVAGGFVQVPDRYPRQEVSR